MGRAFDVKVIAYLTAITDGVDFTIGIIENGPCDLTIGALITCPEWITCYPIYVLTVIQSVPFTCAKGTNV